MAIRKEDKIIKGTDASITTQYSAVGTSKKIKNRNERLHNDKS
jgi:hypothetical protein